MATEDTKLKVPIGNNPQAFMHGIGNGMRDYALLYNGKTLTRINWTGFSTDNGITYADFDLGQNAVHARELSGSLRDKAPSLVLLLARAVRETVREYPGFLGFEYGAIPLSSILFTGNGCVLLMPGQITRMMDYGMTESQRISDRNCWFAYNTYGDWSRAVFLAQLLYYAVCGKPPFADNDVRENNSTPVPLALIAGNTPLAGFVDKILTMPRKSQYRIKDPLEFFIDGLTQILPDTDMKDLVCRQSPELESWRTAMAGRARRRRFFRKRGSLLFTLLAVFLVMAGFGIWYISLISRPPETAGMSPVQIIMYYEEARNSIDPQRLKESLAKNADSPDYDEINAMYIISVMKKTYENIDAYITPEQYLSGLVEIKPGTLVYGTTDVQIEQLDGNSWRVSSILWSPEDYYADNGNSEQVPSSFSIHRYSQIQDFTFERKKDYWLVSSIEQVQLTPIDTLTVQY